MFKQIIEREVALEAHRQDLEAGLVKAMRGLAKAPARTQSPAVVAQIKALEARADRCREGLKALEARENPVNALPEAMLYTASYLYLCGLHEWPPSLAHMRSVGMPLPRKSRVLEKCLFDALALGWGALSDRGCFLWTDEGREELTALKEIQEMRKP